MNINYQDINWDSIDKVEYNGTTGIAYWQTIQYPGLRIRIVEYSANYEADHWCEKGHIVHCLEGEFESHLINGGFSTLYKGMSYVVSDGMSSHKSISEKGCKLIIIDGDFLK